MEVQVLDKFAGQVDRSLPEWTSVHLAQHLVLMSLMEGSPVMLVPKGNTSQMQVAESDFHRVVL